LLLLLLLRRQGLDDHRYMRKNGLFKVLAFIYNLPNASCISRSHGKMTVGSSTIALIVPQLPQIPLATEVQGRQGPFSSCHNQMQSLIQLLDATISRKCESRSINDSVINPDDHLIVQQSSPWYHPNGRFSILPLPSAIHSGSINLSRSWYKYL
jgi:hypothetical protein